MAVTARNKARKYTHRELIDKLKEAPCTDCGETFPPCVMHFDHLDAKTKKFNISKKLHCSLRVILDEIAKCELVCANCHAIRTFITRRQSPFQRKAVA